MLSIDLDGNQSQSSLVHNDVIVNEESKQGNITDLNYTHEVSDVASSVSIGKPKERSTPCQKTTEDSLEMQKMRLELDFMHEKMSLMQDYFKHKEIAYINKLEEQKKLTRLALNGARENYTRMLRTVDALEKPMLLRVPPIN